MSNFTDVAMFNDLIGNTKGDPAAPDWEAIERQFALINEEFHELLEAIQTKDLTLLRDGAADTLVTTYGLLHRIGIDADLDMQEVSRSNMSKFCSCLDEAVTTAIKYEKTGLCVTARNMGNGTFSVRSQKDQYDNDGKYYPEGKLLKGINFSEPTFT